MGGLGLRPFDSRFIIIIIIIICCCFLVRGGGGWLGLGGLGFRVLAVRFAVSGV